MARVALPESRMRARRRRRRLITGSLGVLAVLLMFGGAVWFFQASFLRISHIHVYGTQTVASSTVEAFAADRLKGDYLYLFPKNNIFLYPKKEIIEELLATMPVLASVNISVDNFQAISLALVERQPKAMWCGAASADPAPCFLLDENGLAYGAALNFSGNAYTHYFGSLLGSTTPKQYLTPPDFHSLSALVDTIAANQKSETLAGVWVDDAKDVHLQFASGFTLLFTLEADGGDVYQRFGLALGSEPFTSHALDEFEYLDLRFGDKLYYKLK